MGPAADGIRECGSTCYRSGRHGRNSTYHYYVCTKQTPEGIEELSERSRPAEALSDAGKRFIESWGTIGELLDDADPAEQRQILRQYIDRVGLRS